MAATDIGPTLTATFDAAIPVPADGDYANQATLINMVKPIANRTAYLKQIAEDAPWRKSEFFEDFFVNGSADPATNLAQYNSLWTFTRVGTPSLSQTTAIGADELGTLSIENSSGSASAARLSKGDIISVGPALSHMANFRRAVVRVKTLSIVSGMNFEVGLGTGGGTAVAESSASITAIFQPSASPNWRLRTHDGGAAVFVDTGVPVAINTWYQLDLVSDGVNVVSLSVNGATPVVADPGDLPAMTTICDFLTRFEAPNAGAGRTWRCDFVYGRFENTSRIL